MTDNWQLLTFLKTDQNLIIVTLISVSELVQPASCRAGYLLEAALLRGFFYRVFPPAAVSVTMRLCFLPCIPEAE
ncbi:hypothetical protein ASQ50_13790 [Marinobacter sp. LQ44]|nr:hypothetical protein ASQ50_13790 [Marinobacter sp. LQ44]